MDGGFDHIKFIDPDAIPYGLVVVISALVLNRLVASSLDALMNPESAGGAGA